MKQERAGEDHTRRLGKTGRDGHAPPDSAPDPRPDPRPAPDLAASEEGDWLPGPSHRWTEWEWSEDPDSETVVTCSAYEFADGGGVDGPARADLNAEQKAWIEKLRTLFPRGFVFGTPACEADAPFFEPRRQHIVFSHINIEYVWDALYEHFELTDDESPDDAQCP